jgi:AraC family ethanolamine operon transcriptional activator
MPEREIIRRGNKLVGLLRSLLDLKSNQIHPNALITLEAEIVDVVFRMVPSTDVAEPLHRRAKVAMKLRDMLQGSLETPLTVTAMCKALGVRERTVFLTCLEAFGRPPKTMLPELRLNAVLSSTLHPNRWLQPRRPVSDFRILETSRPSTSASLRSCRPPRWLWRAAEL